MKNLWKTEHENQTQTHLHTDIFWAKRFMPLHDDSSDVDGAHFPIGRNRELKCVAFGLSDPKQETISIN